MLSLVFCKTYNGHLHCFNYSHTHPISSKKSFIPIPVFTICVVIIIFMHSKSIKKKRHRGNIYLYYIVQGLLLYYILYSTESNGFGLHIHLKKKTCLVILQTVSVGNKINIYMYFSAHTNSILFYESQYFKRPQSTFVITWSKLFMFYSYF